MNGDLVTVPVEKKWDSQFFGFPIGSVTLPISVNGETLRARMKDWQQLGFRLIYVFVEPLQDVTIPLVLHEAGAVSFGTRVTYRKMYASLDSYEGHEGCVAVKKNPALENIAYMSGACSRFLRDERLRVHFKRLYGAWLDKELSGGKVFVFPDLDSPVGLATVTLCEDKLRGCIGKIGLVAVDERHRRRGVAKSLMGTLEMWLRRVGACGCEVVTQGENTAARSLYETSGFQRILEVGVWHLWMLP